MNNIPVKKRNNGGYAMIFVLVVMAVVMSVCGIITLITRQNLNTVMLQQVNAKGYYVAREMSDVIVSALMTGDEGNKKIDEIKDQLKTKDIPETPFKLTYYMPYKEPTIDTYFKIKHKNMTDDQSGVSTDWVSVLIKVKIPDYRFASKDSTEKSYYDYYYEMDILYGDNDVRTYNIIDSSTYG